MWEPWREGQLTARLAVLQEEHARKISKVRPVLVPCFVVGNGKNRLLIEEEEL